MSYMGLGEITHHDFEELDYLFEEYFPSREEIWLFETGKFATAFYHYLKICQVKIAGFVETSPKAASYLGEKVISIHDLEERYSLIGPGRLSLLLTIGQPYYGEVYPNLMFLKKEDLYFLKGFWKESAVDRCGEVKDISLAIPVADYCRGIACYGCTVCGPIAAECIYDLEQYKRDMLRVRELIGDLVIHVYFTGGDVFLNPRFVEYVEFARELYPDAWITSSVNGVHFPDQEDSVWERLGKCRIIFNWTLYPIEYPNMSETVNRIRELSNGGVKIRIFGDDGNESKTSWKIPYTFKKQKFYDWLLCRFHKDNNQLLTVWKGRLAACYSLRRLKWLSVKYLDYFTDDFTEVAKPEKTSLDIASIKNAEEILEFMTRRLPICDYCAIRERRSMEKWLYSKGAFDEWFVEE